MATGFLDLIRIATAELVKVGPKGYIHGWIHVGVPGVGDHVFHPRHGDGKVTHLDEHGHVHVRFDSGKTRSFAHGTGTGHGLARRTGGDKFSEHLRAAGAANRRGDHTAAADHYRQAANAATHPKIKAEMLARAERDAGKTPGNPTVEKPPVPVAPKSKYDEHMAAARDAAKRGDIPTAVRHYQEAGVHAPSKIHRNVAVRERTALDNTGTPKALTADEHDAEAARHNAAAADLEAKAKNLPAGVGNANGAGQHGRAQAAMAADARAHRQEADRHTAAALALRPKPTGGASGGKTKPGSDKAQFQVTMPDGTVETRNSEHPYTHAVVVPHDNHAQAAALERSAARRESNIKDKPDLYPPDVAAAHRRAADKERAQAADLRAKPQTGHHVYRWSASPKGAEAGVKEYRKNGGTGTPQIVQVGTDMSKPSGGTPAVEVPKPPTDHDLRVRQRLAQQRERAARDRKRMGLDAAKPVAEVPNAPSPDQVVPGGTHVRDLKDGQYARLIGTDQYGQRTVLEGYVSTPTAFRVGPKRGKKKDMLGVSMSETPSGHGANWRGQVFVPPTALTEKPTFGGKPAVPEDTGWVELPKPVKDVTPPSTPPQPLPEAMTVRGSLDEQKAARDMNRARDRIYDAQKAGDKAAETKAHAKYAEAKTRHDAANAATRADSETRHAGDLHRERVEGDAERAVMAGDHANAAAKYRELAQSIRDDKGGYNVHRNVSAVNGRQWAVQHSDPNRRVSDGIFTGFKSRESAENAAGVKAESRAKEAERLATINEHAAASGNGEAAQLRVSGNRKLGMSSMYTAERNGRDSHPIAGAMTDEELKNATDASDLVLMNHNPTIDRALSDKIRGHLDAESTRRGLPQHSVTQRLSEESAKRRAERGATPVPAAGHPLAAAINHDHQAEEHRLNAQTLRARGQKLNAKTDPGGVKRADLNAKAEHHWAQARTESDAAQTIRQNATDPDHRMTLGQLDQHADQAIKEGRNHDAARMFAATADRMRAGEKFTSLNRGYTSGWKVSDPDRTSAGEFGARKDAEAHRERREAEILAVRDRMAKDYAARGHAAKPYNARQQDSVETARRRSGNPHLLIGAHEKLSKEDFHGLIPEHQQKVTEHVEGLGQRSPGEVHNRAQALLDRWNGKPAGVEKPSKKPSASVKPVRNKTYWTGQLHTAHAGPGLHTIENTPASRSAMSEELTRQGVDGMAPLRGVLENYRGSHHVFHRDESGKIDAAVDYTHDKKYKEIHINDVRVVPKGKGIGTQMLGHVARAHPGHTMKVYGAVESAKPWYAKTGAEMTPHSSFGEWDEKAMAALRADKPIPKPYEPPRLRTDDRVIAPDIPDKPPVSKVDEHLAAADAKLRAGDRVGALNHLNIAAGHEKDAKARQAIIERQKTLGAELMGKKPPAVPPVEPKPVASSRAAEIAGKLRNVESRYQAHRIISLSGPGGSTPTMDHLGNVGRESGTGHVLASGIKKDKAIDRMADEAFRQAEESRAGTPMPHVVDASLNAGERSLASGDLTLAQHHVGEATARARNEADRKRIKNLGERVETAQTQARADRDAAHRASLAEFDAKGQAAADAARAKFKPETITNPDLRAATEQHIENVRQDTTLQARMARGHSVAREADRAQTNVLRSQTDMSRIEGSRQLLSGTPSEGLIQGRATAIENADRDATAEAHRVATAAGVDPATVETHRAALATHMGAANVAAVERNVADQRAKDLRFAGNNAYDPQVRRAFLAEADKSEADKVAAEQRRAAADVKAARARAELRFAAAPPKHVPAVVKPKKPRATPARPAAGRPYVEPSGLKPGAKVTWTHHYEDGSNGERTGRVWDAAPTSRGHDAAWVIPDERKPTDPYSALVVEQNKKTGKTTSHDVGTSHTGGLAQSAAAVAARHRAQRKSFPYQIAALVAVIREVNAAYRRLVTA